MQSRTVGEALLAAIAVPVVTLALVQRRVAVALADPFIGISVAPRTFASQQVVAFSPDGERSWSGLRFSQDGERCSIPYTMVDYDSNANN